MNEGKLTREEKEERGRKMKELLDHVAWEKYIKPWLEKQRDYHRDILNIDDNNDDAKFTKEARSGRAKASVYNTILNLPKQWIREAKDIIKNNKKKEAKNG
jgi:hypothetical protein